jgi:hypothetical protein
MVKLTEWFSAETNPVHVGVYQVDRGKQGKWFRKWTGSYWSLCEPEVKLADNVQVKSPVGSFPWRGLVK